ncbi:hypothetical protein PTSG_01725 [Salpingoeca rosetta]|uniref:Testis-expressed sequence 9 protein n=1 Tax=Salpingoeca rosetta (strain ATCC 50818 / BSB-021) TaxID=946362 RepID=F2TYS2_SALR5|nr:uncharacterized protein PTSG_01725 [Salpingoeca rosetta]EGD78746.1 hypothetical protein PTSG_01725 [Salpingoeca rosetta]|eukprot:XP_004997703.1 hypothetical protein PTSG_01725 [Salpingoeca rosetta]
MKLSSALQPSSHEPKRDKKTRPYTSAGRPTASASRGVAARRSPSKFKTTTATTATAGPSSRRPRTAGALARSVGSVGGDEFTRGDPLLQAVDAGELGDEAAVRVLKAKLKVTMEQMDAATEELKAVKNELQSLKSQHKDTSKEATKEKKSAQAAQRSANQMKRLLDDMTGKYEREKERAKDLQAEVDAMKRKAKQESAGNQGLEVRLNRALEERDNLKLQLQKLKERPAQASDADLKALEDEIKQLRKQRNEVLEAFEKALRLVDVLKRQKVHLEAARALAFTEEEFIQALDWRQLE